MSISIPSADDGATAPSASVSNPADHAPPLDSSDWRQTLTAAEAWDLLRDRMRLADEVYCTEPEPGSPVALFMAGGPAPPGWDLGHLLNHWGVAP
jgi:hypothetical protein